MAAIDVQLTARPTVEITHQNVFVGGVVTEQINGVTIGTAVSGSTNNQVIENTLGTPVGTSANPSVVPDATVQLNGVDMTDIASGVTDNISIRQSSGATEVGSKQGTHWRIDDSAISINGSPVADVKAEDSLDIDVTQDGSPVGSWNGSEWVVPPCTPPSLSVSVSDSSPDVGDIITITAAQTGLTGTVNYYYQARKGNEVVVIGSNTTGTIDWTVSIDGSIDIYVEADNSVGSAFNIDGEPITAFATIIVTDIQLWLDPFRSSIVAPTYPDISGFNRDGTLVNAPTVVAGDLTPNGGGYIELNGIDQYVGSIGSVSDFAFVQNTLQFTMMGFVRVTDLTKDNVLISNAPSSAEKGFIFNALGTNGAFRTRRIYIIVNKGISGQAYTIQSNDNAINSVGWNHIAITCNGYGTGQIYLNGVAITTNLVTTTTTYPTGNSTRSLFVGTSFFSGSPLYPLSGRIGPVQGYDYEFTAAQVLENFDADRARYGL